MKGPLGDTVTFNVDARVKRLLEINVGDLDQAKYYVSLVAELRKPTAEEAEHPSDFDQTLRLWDWPGSMSPIFQIRRSPWTWAVGSLRI